MNNKIIVLDFGAFQFQSIFSRLNNPSIPSTYLCLASIIGCLKRIGVNKEDKVIVACDFLGSWRKEYEKSYKADRKAKRKEYPIDWDYEFKQMNLLLENIEEATRFNVVKISKMEADDIAAIACKVFKDQEKILVSFDSDWEQLWEYGNVKIFSPKSKRYKIKPNNFSVYMFLSKKIEKEVADNLTSPILNEEDYNRRMTCVNLLELPREHENTIKEVLENLPDKKEEEPELLLFDSLAKRFPQIYNEGTEPYEKSVKYYARKDKKKKVKRSKK